MPGVVVRCRPVGMLKMTDEAGGDTKLLAVPIDKLTPLYRDIETPRDLPRMLLDQITHFFEHYKDLEPGKWVRDRGLGRPRGSQGGDSRQREALQAAEKGQVTCNLPGAPGELAVMIARVALAACLSSLALPAAGGECAAQSGAARAALVELYTSEGCSSCPPADRWFSRLPLEGPTTRLVPLAFHVEYWDYIGWKDRFADPAWSARQREAVRRARRQDGLHAAGDAKRARLPALARGRLARKGGGQGAGGARDDLPSTGSDAGRAGARRRHSALGGDPGPVRTLRGAHGKQAREYGPCRREPRQGPRARSRGTGPRIARTRGSEGRLVPARLRLGIGVEDA